MRKVAVLLFPFVFLLLLLGCATRQDVNSAYKDGYFDALEKYENELNSMKEKISSLENKNSSLYELCDEQYSLGYEDGHHEGFITGIDKGYKNAFNEGYSTGFEYCYSNGYSTHTQGGKNPWELYKEKMGGNPNTMYSSIVYTQIGDERYHTDGCSKITEEKTQMTENEAIEKGYSPCIHCNP